MFCVRSQLLNFLLLFRFSCVPLSPLISVLTPINPVSHAWWTHPSLYDMYRSVGASGWNSDLGAFKQACRLDSLDREHGGIKFSTSPLSFSLDLPIYLSISCFTSSKDLASCSAERLDWNKVTVSSADFDFLCRAADQVTSRSSKSHIAAKGGVGSLFWQGFSRWKESDRA
jgi:hypothetical protein